MSEVQPSTKQCQACQQFKPLEAFASTTSKRCRQCYRKRKEEIRQEKEARMARIMAGKPKRQITTTEDLDLRKRCQSCKERRPVADFNLSPKAANNAHRKDICRDCEKEEKRKKRREQREEVQRKKRAYLLSLSFEDRILAIAQDRFSRYIQNRYGLSTKHHNEILQAQKGLCAICHNPPAEYDSLVVDHNHITGVVRGLLCVSCNMGLGLFKDNPDALINAANYLKNSSWSLE